MSNRQILLLIAAFILLTFGSFIWFVVTWNAEAEPQLGHLGAPGVYAETKDTTV